MKILFLTSRLPYPLDKGDKLRAFHQIKALSPHAEIYLASITEDDTPKEHFLPLHPYLAQCFLLRITNLERIISLIKAIFSKQPFQTAWFYSPAIKKRIDQIADEIQPDVIFVQLARMAAYKLTYPATYVIDYMDAFGVGMERRGSISSGIFKWLYSIEGMRMIAYEKAIAKQFDHRLIISAQDRDQILHDSKQPIAIFPNGIDRSFLTYEYTQPKSSDISFIGNMSYLPNIDAAVYLCEKIFPLLPSHLTLEIAGVNPSRRIKALATERIKVTGYVKDIREAYGRSKLFCAPLMSGTGQQNKILEAMAIGVPCIATTAVNKAIGGRHMKEIIIADDAHQFAQSIELLLSNTTLYSEISINARSFVENQYQWEKHASELIDLLANKADS